MNRELIPDNIRHRRDITQGVSGARTFYGYLDKRGKPVPVVVKIGPGVGRAEAAGAITLEPYLPVMEILGFEEDMVITRYRKGLTLDKANQRGREFNTLAEFVSAHADLWQATAVTADPNELRGYHKKQAHTEALLANTFLPNIDGRKVPLGQLMAYDFIVNGRSLGTLTEIISKMQDQFNSISIGSLVHGDENLSNVRVAVNGSWFMIDLNTASLRSPYESIAKILMWMDATSARIISRQASISDRDKKAYLNIRTQISPNALKTIDIARHQLTPFLDTKEEKMLVAACIMTYLIRETQWLEKRGRQHLAPYLIARALSFAPALDGVEFPYPLSLFPNLDGKIFNF